MEPSADVYRELGRLIRLHRERLTLSQAALARRVGLSRTSVTNIEQGRQKILVHQLLSFAVALGTSPEALLPTADTAPIPADVESKLRKHFTGRETEWARRIVFTVTKGGADRGEDQDARPPAPRRAQR